MLIESSAVGLSDNKPGQAETGRLSSFALDFGYTAEAKRTHAGPQKNRRPERRLLEGRFVGGRLEVRGLAVFHEQLLGLLGSEGALVLAGDHVQLLLVLGPLSG